MMLPLHVKEISTRYQGYIITMYNWSQVGKKYLFWFILIIIIGECTSKKVNTSDTNLLSSCNIKHEFSIEI